jgi:hypothetical protein
VFAVGLLVSPFAWRESSGTESVPMFLADTLVTLGIEAFLIWKISHGANWARITKLAFFLISLALLAGIAFFGARPKSHHSTMVWAVFGIQTLLDCAACVLLFRDPANEWFKSPPRLIRLANEQR